MFQISTYNTRTRALAQTEEMATEEEIVNAVDEDRYDQITSTYYLLAERCLLKQREEMNKKMIIKSSEGSGSSQSHLYHHHRKQPHSPCPSSSYAPPVAYPNTSGAKPRHHHNFQQHQPRHRSNSCSLDDSSSKAPLYIREHLTITPRRGFSVARGGIDTLIEEEERSRSQTTTDDEEADDDVNINPNVLASRFVRSLH